MSKQKDVEFLCEMTGVREYGEGYTVDLIRNQAVNRLVIRAHNECNCNTTEVDLLDLMDWLMKGPKTRQTPEGFEIALWNQFSTKSDKR
jgi:hypothetical protein